MSTPLGLALSSEVVSAMSSLNMYPGNQCEGKYISSLYPETIVASKHLSDCLEVFCSSTSKLFNIDLEGFKNNIENKDFKYLDYFSISDELPYRKSLLLAKEELLKVKDLHYEIEHSIEHIDSALSFVNISFRSPFLFNFKDVIKELSDEKLSNLIYSEFCLKGTKNV